MNHIRTHDRTARGPRRVAIIGSGIAGSSAAYWLREAFGDNLRIVVFEQAPYIGGRMHRILVAGTPVETGATLIHSSNAYLDQFMRVCGLERTHPHRRRADEPSTTGIWNGTTFVFKTQPTEWQTTARMLARYRSAPLRTRALVREHIHRWTQIYVLQQQGMAYATPQAMFEALNLYALTQQSSYTLFEQHHIQQRFVEEFIDGVSRVNYGQSGSIHAFVNMISLAGAGLAGGELFSVRDGNAQICERLLARTHAEVRTNTRVTEITRSQHDQPHQPCYAITTNHTHEQDFDTVIVASPLELASIRCTAIDGLKPEQVQRPYQVTHATFVAGALNSSYFHQPRSARLPDMILTPEHPTLPFSSIGRIGPLEHKEQSLFKVFSREPLSDDLLSRMFRQPSDVTRVPWQAYPVLAPTEAWPPFRIQDGLYYVNAMESAVSTMETEAVASRNVVQLFMQDLQTK